MRGVKDALEKLQVNDAAFLFEPETSTALGFGFRCGFLGLLHMEIIVERLEREFGLAVITTSPSVVYKVVLTGWHGANDTESDKFAGSDRRLITSKSLSSRLTL